MPFYEFQCAEGTVTERLVKCNRRAKKILSACSFKLVGGGWYADGYSSAKTGSKKTSTKSAKKEAKTPKK
jgi:predicted nucleic acid-binding Zn ribbon protein